MEEGGCEDGRGGREVGRIGFEEEGGGFIMLKEFLRMEDFGLEFGRELEKAKKLHAFL